MRLLKGIINVKNNTNFKHGILYTLFSFINSGISFILVLILAKYLTPSDYGQLNLFNTFVTLLNIIISLGSASYVAVSFFQKDNDSLQKIILVVLGISSSVLILISMILLIFPNFVERSIGVGISYLWLGILISYFQVFNSINLDIWRLEEKPISYGIYSVSFAVCNFVLTFWLIVGNKLGWEGRVYAWWLLGLLYFIISIIFLIKRRYLKFSRVEASLILETLIYALPLLPHNASFWLKQGLDRYIINYFHDQSVVGYFSFAMNLAAIIGIIGNAFNATNSVFIYKKLAEGYSKVKSTLSKQTRIMTFAFLFASICVMIFAFGLIKIVLPKYDESLIYIIPLCLGGFFQCIYLLWVNYLFYYKRTKTLMYITVSTAILQVVLSLWLTRYSPLYTAFISMGITLLTMLLVIKESRNTLYLNTHKE